MISSRRLLNVYINQRYQNMNILAKSITSVRDLVMYTFFPGFSVFFVFYYRAGGK